jgi:hypothetical protein
MQQIIEPDDESVQPQYLMDGDQHAGHERIAVHRVVADSQDLPLTAEQHLVMSYQPRQAHAVKAHAFVLRAAAAGQRLLLRHVRGEWLAPRAGHVLRDPHARAGRGVDLLIVVQLDDLGRVEVARSDPGEVHRQHHAQGEVWRHKRAGACLGGAVADALQLVRPHARRADDRPHARVERGQCVSECRVGDGEVDQHLRLGVGDELPQVGRDREGVFRPGGRLDVHAANHLEVVRRRDGADHHAAHAAQRPGDGHADHGWA